MPKNNQSLNRELFNLLHSRGYDPVLLDTTGKEIPTPEEAEVLQFNFVKDDVDYGKVTISIDGLHKLVIYFNDKIADSEKEDTGSGDLSWYKLLNQLKYFAKRYQLSFELKNTSNLKPDMAKRTYMKKQQSVTESYQVLNKKTSLNDSVPNVKIILQHTKALDENDKRYLNVEKIYVENVNGERFLVPTRKPGLARVYARHIAEGGTPYDERGRHISSLVEEYSKMAGFVRAVKNSQFNESAQKLVTEGVNHYNNLKETLKRLSGHRGYNMYFESWTPTLMETEGEEANLNELFVQETLDPRIESVMPILSRLSKNISEMAEVKDLAEWAENIIEDESLTSNNPQGIPESEKNVTYAHKNDPKGVRFRQPASAELPVWATDVKDDAEPNWDEIEKAQNWLNQWVDADHSYEEIVNSLEGEGFSPETAEHVALDMGRMPGMNEDGETFTLKDKADYLARRKALQGIQMDPDTSKDNKLKSELIRKKNELEKQAKEKGFAFNESEVEEGVLDKVKSVGKKVGKKVADVLGGPGDEELLQRLQKNAGVPRQHGKPRHAIPNDEKELEENSDDMAKTAHMHGLKHGRQGTGDNMDNAKSEWGDNFKDYNAGFLKGRNQKAKDLKASGQGYGKKQQGVAEDLGPEQKRVGQLGPIEKVKKNSGARGKLVGASESVEQTNDTNITEGIDTVYPDSKEGVLQCLKDEFYDPKFLKKLDLATCKIYPDQSVEGVWAIDSMATGQRCVIYLAGYKDPMGKVRKHNDSEEGTMPMSAMKKLAEHGKLTPKLLSQWVKMGSIDRDEMKLLSDIYQQHNGKGMYEGKYETNTGKLPKDKQEKQQKVLDKKLADKKAKLDAAAKEKKKAEADKIGKKKVKEGQEDLETILRIIKK